MRTHPRERPLAYSPDGELYLGSHIRARRQAKGWSLSRFAELLDYNLAYLSSIETNAICPSRALLERIAPVLEVPLADLLQAPIPPNLQEKRNGRPPRQAKARPAPAPLDEAISADPEPQPADEMPRNGARLRPAAAPPEVPSLSTWTLGDQVNAIIESFRLSPLEQHFAAELIADLTRSLCLRLKADPSGELARPRRGA